MRNRHCNRTEDFELNDDIVAEENVLIRKVYPFTETISAFQC